MSVDINIKHAKKCYGTNTIIPDLSLRIKNGEFFTLLGPSGCGKTTLLRMIAGFNSIEGGDFFFDQQRINDLDPSKRNIGMVFQNYAIFPNMSVRKNVEFGLKYKKLDKATIQSEADQFMKLVYVDQYADRMPDRLSGGQQQRVALARALVIKPDVLLMDEPLSNLDAKLRVEMRTAIKQLQHEVGITTVYVTHDQEEAMAVSDRIAVMKDGEIHHCASPQNIYQRPADLFVATFIGKTNILKAKAKADQGNCILQFTDSYHQEVQDVTTSLLPSAWTDVLVSVRPEEFVVQPMQNQQTAGLRGIVKDSVFLGLNTHYFVELESKEQVEVIQESKIGKFIKPNTEIILTIDSEKVNLFETQRETSLMQGVVQDLEGTLHETQN